MKIFNNNRNLLIISLVAIVNALGYGIIIPILYSYSIRYGLTDFENGLLFATFSVFQFFSTPVIGRLSDKYGRKPLLIISISGTAVSFLMMAFAPNAFFLFLSRALDGITAGNIPVASAVISDTTAPEDRARGFGIISASFGFGFVFGPAISAFTVGIFPSMPFIIAAIISFIAVLLTWLFLPETNKHLGEVKARKFFDFKKIYHALFYPNTGQTLLITMFFFLGIFSFIYAFQPYSLKSLDLTPSQVSWLYTLFGLLGLMTQLFFIQRVTRFFGLKRAFSGSLITVTISLLMMFAFHSLIMFFISMVILAISNNMVQPLISTILSRETDAKSQGSILGLNASYMSIGQILGPIVGGIFASISLSYPFLAGSMMVLICFLLSFKVLRPHLKKESAF